MDFSNICEVVELIRIDKINSYLKLGWELLLVGQQSEEGVSYVSYSLGWPKSKGTPLKPEEDTKEYGNML